MRCFHSIGIPSEWGLPIPLIVACKFISFHSIGIPSEWGLMELLEKYVAVLEFPFNWDPQRVGTSDSDEALLEGIMTFPFNWDPQRVGTVVFPLIV